MYDGGGLWTSKTQITQTLKQTRTAQMDHVKSQIQISRSLGCNDTKHIKLNAKLEELTQCLENLIQEPIQATPDSAIKINLLEDSSILNYVQYKQKWKDGQTFKITECEGRVKENVTSKDVKGKGFEELILGVKMKTMMPAACSNLA